MLSSVILKLLSAYRRLWLSFCIRIVVSFSKCINPLSCKMCEKTAQTNGGTTTSFDQINLFCLYRLNDIFLWFKKTNWFKVFTCSLRTVLSSGDWGVRKTNLSWIIAPNTTIDALFINDSSVFSVITWLIFWSLWRMKFVWLLWFVGCLICYHGFYWMENQWNKWSGRLQQLKIFKL